MNRTKLKLICVLIVLFSPLLYLNKVSVNGALQNNGANTKIGFAWLNNPLGGSETAGFAYAKAVEMGGEIEHRDYSWRSLEATLGQLYEWDYYLDANPEMNSSLAISVINNNVSAVPYDIDFYSYKETNLNDSALIRLNSSLIVERLQNYTDYAINQMSSLSYISFGTEINVYFETLLEENSTVMLEDYADLYAKMYEYITTNYTSLRVMVDFRYQLPSDYHTTEAVIDYFKDSVDLFGMSAKIMTTEAETLMPLVNDAIYQRVLNFTSLIGTKPFAITNIYTISDILQGSSESYQASYVSSALDLVARFDDELEFLCWFTLYDYPPGYLGMIINPIYEPQRTAGLVSHTGEVKKAYFVWINKMRALGRIPDFYAPWKITISSIALAGIVGFVGYVCIAEFYPKIKERRSQEPVPKEITFGITDEDKSKKKNKKKK
jgi:hypothetical protein